MNQYEKRFYEDFHKLVNIQKEILKELQKMNEPLVEDIASKEVEYATPLPPHEPAHKSKVVYR